MRPDREAGDEMTDKSWINWNGGECPVPDDTMVEVQWRDPPFTSTPLQAGRLWWRHSGACDDIVRYRLALERVRTPDNWRFRYYQRVRKRGGASWQGRVVGFYQTHLTEEGYAVESERERGSVQIYPAAALEAVEDER